MSETSCTGTVIVVLKFMKIVHKYAMNYKYLDMLYASAMCKK